MFFKKVKCLVNGKDKWKKCAEKCQCKNLYLFYANHNLFIFYLGFTICLFSCDWPMCIWYINTDVFPKVLLSSSRTLFSLTCRSFRMSLASVSSCTHTQTALISSVALQHHIISRNTISPGAHNPNASLMVWQFRGGERYHGLWWWGKKNLLKSTQSQWEERGKWRKT